MTVAGAYWFDARRSMDQERWTQAMRQVLLAAVAVVLVTFWWASDGRGPQIAALVVAAAVLASLFAVESLWPLWHRVGLVALGGLIAVLVALTGGSASVYQDVFLLVVIGAALFSSAPLGFIGGVVIAAVGAILPIVYEDVDLAFVGDTVADVLVWTVVGVVTWQIERERTRKAHERAVLLERFVTVAEDERSRLADELHDEAIQLLSAAGFRLQTAVRADQPTDLTPVQDLLTDGLLTLRRVILELKGPNLATGSLSDLVHAYADRLLTPLDVAFELDITDPGGTDPAVVTAAYRIIVEALSNVARHARATTASVTVGADNGALVGRVSDDGVGIGQDPQSPPGHIGLRSMRDRAEVVGGSVQVGPGHPDEGGGTVVAFQLPRQPIRPQALAAGR